MKPRYTIFQMNISVSAILFVLVFSLYYFKAIQLQALLLWSPAHTSWRNNIFKQIFIVFSQFFFLFVFSTLQVIPLGKYIRNVNRSILTRTRNKKHEVCLFRWWYFYCLFLFIYLRDKTFDVFWSIYLFGVCASVLWFLFVLVEK